MPEAIAEVRVQGVRRELGGLRRDVSAVQDSLDALERRTQPSARVQAMVAQANAGAAAAIGGGGGRAGVDLTSQLARVGTQEKIAGLQARELGTEWERNQRQTRAWREELERLERQLIRVQTARRGGAREDEEHVRRSQITAGTMRAALAGEETQLRGRFAQLGMRPGGRPGAGGPAPAAGGGGEGGWGALVGGMRFAGLPVTPLAAAYAGVRLVRSVMAASVGAARETVTGLQTTIPLANLSEFQDPFAVLRGTLASTGLPGALARGGGRGALNPVAEAQMALRTRQATGMDVLGRNRDFAPLKTPIDIATLTDMDYRGWEQRNTALNRTQRRRDPDVLSRLYGSYGRAFGQDKSAFAEFADTTQRLADMIRSPLTGTDTGNVSAQLATIMQQFPADERTGGVAREAGATQLKNIYGFMGMGGSGGVPGAIALRAISGLRNDPRMVAAIQKVSPGLDIGSYTGLLEAAQRLPDLVAKMGGTPEGATLTKAYTEEYQAVIPNRETRLLSFLGVTGGKFEEARKLDDDLARGRVAETMNAGTPQDPDRTNLIHAGATAATAGTPMQYLRDELVVPVGQKLEESAARFGHFEQIVSNVLDELKLKLPGAIETGFHDVIKYLGSNVPEGG